MMNFFEHVKSNNINEHSENKTNIYQYNYLIGMVMLFMMLLIASSISVYKLVSIGWFIFPACILIAPLIYGVSNVTTEVYGYTIARNMMWWFLFAHLIFSLTCFMLNQAPALNNFHHKSAFDLVVGSMPRIFIANTIGSIVGLSFNNILVSRLKVIMHGKNYWARSVIATVGGEISYNIIAYPIIFIGHISFRSLTILIISVTILKTASTIIIWPLQCLLAEFLKKNEKINVIDYNVKYKIFSTKTDKQNQKPKLTIVK